MMRVGIDTVRMTAHRMQIAMKACPSVLTDIEAMGCTTAKYLEQPRNIPIIKKFTTTPLYCQVFEKHR